MYFFISYYLHVLNNLQINNNKHFKNEQDASSRLRDYLYCDGHRSQKLTTSTSERTRLYSRRALSQSWDSTARCDTAVLTIWDTHTRTHTYTHWYSLQPRMSTQWFPATRSCRLYEVIPLCIVAQLVLQMFVGSNYPTGVVHGRVCRLRVVYPNIKVLRYNFYCNN